MAASSGLALGNGDRGNSGGAYGLARPVGWIDILIVL